MNEWQAGEGMGLALIAKIHGYPIQEQTNVSYWRSRLLDGALVSRQSRPLLRKLPTRSVFFVSTEIVA